MRPPLLSFVPRRKLCRALASSCALLAALLMSLSLVMLAAAARNFLELTRCLDSSDGTRRLANGGHHRPHACWGGKSSSATAIIVPYRNRENNLRTFVTYLHKFLLKQTDIEYKLYFITQVSSDKVLFNRGKLLNVGFDLASRERDWDCYIFHDVDLLPASDNNRYECTDSPRLLASAQSHHNFSRLYPTYFGGAVAVSGVAFRAANGFSNLYYGWGREDDDLYDRLDALGFKAEANEMEPGRYLALSHPRGTPPKSMASHDRLLGVGRMRMLADGLSDLEYTVLRTDKNRLFTNVTVDI